MSRNSASDFDNLGLYFFSSPTVDAVNPGNGRHGNDYSQVKRANIVAYS